MDDFAAADGVSYLAHASQNEAMWHLRILRGVRANSGADCSLYLEGYGTRFAAAEALDPLLVILGESMARYFGSFRESVNA